MFEPIMKLFKSSPPQKESPSTIEILFDESVLYSAKDFQKYNPDELLIHKGTGIYDKMMLDDQIKAVMEFKIHAITSRGYYFDVEQNEKGEPDAEQQKIADYFNFMIRQIKGNFTNNLAAILSALKFGFSIVEKVFQLTEYDNKTMWGIKDLKLRPFETFDGGFKIDQHGNIEKLEQVTIAADPISIPLNKIIHFVHQPDIDRHYGESDLKAAYRSYWSKDNIIKFQNIHLERHAGGFLWARVTGHLSQEQKKDLKNLINNVSAKMGAMVPGTVELNAFNPMRTDAYEKAVAQHDKAIAKSILVPNLLGLSEQGQTGSYAQATVHLKAFFWILDAITKELEETANEQMFKDLAWWNFGARKYPLFKFEEQTAEQKKETIDAWALMMEKGTVTKSDSDEIYVRKILGFPEKTEEEEKPILPEIPPEGMPPVPEGTIPPKGTQPADQIPPGETKQAEIEKRKFAAKAWLRRVDFVRMKNDLDSQDKKFVKQLADIMGQIKDSIYSQITTIVGPRSLGYVKPNEFKVIRVPSKFTSVLKSVLRDNLQEIIDKGYAAAKEELPKRHVKKAIRPGMDKTQIEAFFKTKSEFWITGVLEQDVLNAVNLELQSGIKYDKTLGDTIKALDEDTNLVAVLPATDAAGRAINIPARLENVVRTNTADALNQARGALFGDPSLKGFILAYEYSAVLDDRTTEVCDALGGRIRKDWGAQTPPNHYQCRSILAPVTVLDEWDGKESNIPAKGTPQKGFG